MSVVTAALRLRRVRSANGVALRRGRLDQSDFRDYDPAKLDQLLLWSVDLCRR